MAMWNGGSVAAGIRWGFPAQLRLLNSSTVQYHYRSRVRPLRHGAERPVTAPAAPRWIQAGFLMREAAVAACWCCPAVAVSTM